MDVRAGSTRSPRQSRHGRRQRLIRSDDVLSASAAFANARTWMCGPDRPERPACPATDVARPPAEATPDRRTGRASLAPFGAAPRQSPGVRSSPGRGQRGPALPVGATSVANASRASVFPPTTAVATRLAPTARPCPTGVLSTRRSPLVIPPAGTQPTAAGPGHQTTRFHRRKDRMTAPAPMHRTSDEMHPGNTGGTSAARVTPAAPHRRPHPRRWQPSPRPHCASRRCRAPRFSPAARIPAPLRDNRAMTTHSTSDDALVIAGKSYHSRLLTGTGKFRDLDETRRATEAAGAQIVTVAIRRTNIGQDPGEPNLLDVLPPDRYTILPNTAGCYTAEDAVRTCRLARELLDGHNLTKLEVLGDQKTLYPDVVQTL